MTRTMAPWLPRKKIYDVNRAIDNPTPTDIMFHQMFGDKFNMPGLDASGHREPNHNMLSAMMIGFRTGGIQGAQIAMQHLYQDIMSDAMIKNFGYEGRDVFEAMMNYMMVGNNRTINNNKKMLRNAGYWFH